MEYLFFAVGILVGVIIATIFGTKGKIYGVVEIDHDTQQCKFRITSNELSNRKNKMAVFEIKHDAIISRDEHSL